MFVKWSKQGALTTVLILVGLVSGTTWFINKYFWIEQQALVTRVITRIWRTPTVRQIEERKLRQVAGWFSHDCGHVSYLDNADPEIACASEAIKTHQPFYVSFDFAGIDSEGIIGIAENRKHVLYEVTTDESLGGYIGKGTNMGTMRTVTVTRCERSPTEQTVPPGNRFLSCVGQ